MRSGGARRRSPTAQVAHWSADHIDVSLSDRPAESDRLTPALEPYLDHPVERRASAGGRRVTDVRTNVRQGRTGCRIVDLPRVADPRGNLTMIEGGEHVPFELRRVYYLYDVPGGASRGGHAHRELEQFVIAASGSLDVLVDDGVHRERFFLSRSYYGLYIPRMVWRELDNFSSGSVCLVLASEHYDRDDYYYDYDEFRADLR
jgi:dTDP-4-dehydrorhamnose 3,5-epimerase-like enzyme